jgi:hypothetical protein
MQVTVPSYYYKIIYDILTIENVGHCWKFKANILKSEKLQVTIASFVSWTRSAPLVVRRFAGAARRTRKTMSCRQTRRMVARRLVR